MSVHIVDASVAAKWFTEEEHSEQALAFLRDNEKLFAPDFFLLEMDNLVCKWMRRGLLKREEGDSIRTVLRMLDIEYYDSGKLQDHAYEIACKTGRALYDCLYLALAILIEGKTVTADRKLFKAMTDTPFADIVSWVGSWGQS